MEKMTKGTHIQNTIFLFLISLMVKWKCTCNGTYSNKMLPSNYVALNMQQDPAFPSVCAQEWPTGGLWSLFITS